MIELQMLNKILSENSTDMLIKYHITDKHFVVYKNEYRFIMSHFNQFGNMPDKETLIDKFPDFDFIEVNESWEYLVNTLNEQNAFNSLVPILKKSAELIEVNALDAIQYLQGHLENLQNEVTLQQLGIDIVDSVDDRVSEYEQRLKLNGMLGIPTGLKELDEVMFGMMKEDLIIVLGRPNQGKSWVTQHFANNAWKQGNTVLHYSGEMSTHLVGFRFDTLNSHISNTSMLKGDKSIHDEYISYGDNLQGKPYIVVTPKQLGGKRLDVPTLERLINIYNPDMINLDQLTLMADARRHKGDPKNVEIGHITEDLFILSEKYGIPIVLAHQAGRKADTKSDEDTPGMGDAYGGDGVEQNATRLIGIKQVPVGIKLSLKKNRYGDNNRDFIYNWDIDKGIITDTPVASTSEKEVEYTEGSDLF